MATQAEDTGWYLWNVPGPATTTAKVRIRYHETPSVTRHERSCIHDSFIIAAATLRSASSASVPKISRHVLRARLGPTVDAPSFDS